MPKPDSHPKKHKTSPAEILHLLGQLNFLREELAVLPESATEMQEAAELISKAGNREVARADA